MISLIKKHSNYLSCFGLFKVDGAEESTIPGDNKVTSKFQSIGVQVEEEKW